MASALFRIAYEFLSGHSVLARALLLAALTFALTAPLGLLGGIVTDRQSYQQEAVKSIKSSWGTSQTFTGPRILVPYKDKTGSWQVVFLPQKLTITGEVPTEQRRRGLFSVSVYRASLDVVAEFDTRALQGMTTAGNELDWSAARLLVGVSGERSLSADTVEVDGQQIEWIPDTNDRLAALQAPFARIDPAARNTLTVRFRLAAASCRSCRSASARRSRSSRRGGRRASSALTCRPARQSRARASRPAGRPRRSAAATRRSGSRRRARRRRTPPCSSRRSAWR